MALMARRVGPGDAVLVPAFTFVASAEAFPMTVTGKIQKFKMREMAIEELGLQDAARIETA